MSIAHGANGSKKRTELVYSMSTASYPNTARTGGSVISELQSQVQACQSFPSLLSVDLGTENVNPLTWLRNQPTDIKIAWSNRDNDECLVAAGAAAEVTAGSDESIQEIIERCRNLVDGSQGLKLFGGFRFRQAPQSKNHPTNNEWSPFSSARFWLPRLTYDGQEITCVVLSEADKVEALRAIDGMNEAPFASELQSIPKWSERHDSPDREGWTRNISKAIELFRREFLEKIVLARKATFQFDAPVNAVDLTARLVDATYGCYQYCFQLHDELAFVGATPERLFRRENKTLLTEAVAGTRPRSADKFEDERLAAELLASEKDQLEHQIVRKSIRQQLHRCLEPDSLSVSSKPRLMPLARTQHLCSVVQAKLRDSISDGQIIERLHPTPAVGGYPTDNALSEIERLEPFDRGWYAAPVGWISADSAEFAVAIRSGLLQGRELSLYTGAGVVPGSVADEEWNEVEHKLIDFVKIIGSE